MPQDTLANQNTAATFVAALGVNTKAGYYIDGYTNASLIINSLDYLGISTVRDSYSQYGQSNTVLDALAAADIKFDFRVSYTLPASGEAGIESYIAAIKAFVAEHPGSVIAIEGINEANIGVFSYNGDSSLAGAAAFQKDLYTAIKADPELSSVVVYNLSLSHGNAADYAALGLGALNQGMTGFSYSGSPYDYGLSFLQMKMLEERRGVSGLMRLYESRISRGEGFSEAFRDDIGMRDNKLRETLAKLGQELASN